MGTPSESKDKSITLGESKMIKNPTYARITHASKQMEFLGNFRTGGATMGMRNGLNHGNFMMKSMPNLDFLK